jgi:hypothetical protein
MPSTSLYARLLGPAFQQLSPILQAIHDARSTKRYIGRCEISGGERRLARFIARFAGLPLASSDVPLEITITTVGASEVWARKFGSQPLHSQLSNRNGHLDERLGPVITSFTLIAKPERIIWSLRRARLAFIPLPITWLLECAAAEYVQEGRYHFDVTARVRGIGLIVHYRGWLIEHDERSR